MPREERHGEWTPWRIFLRPTTLGACGHETLCLSFLLHTHRQPSDNFLASGTGLPTVSAYVSCAATSYAPLDTHRSLVDRPVFKVCSGGSAHCSWTHLRQSGALAWSMPGWGSPLGQECPWRSLLGETWPAFPRSDPFLGPSCLPPGGNEDHPLRLSHGPP